MCAHVCVHARSRYTAEEYWLLCRFYTRGLRTLLMTGFRLHVWGRNIQMQYVLFRASYQNAQMSICSINCVAINNFHLLAKLISARYLHQHITIFFFKVINQHLMRRSLRLYKHPLPHHTFISLVSASIDDSHLNFTGTVENSCLV